VTGSVRASERRHCTPGRRKAKYVKARMPYPLFLQTSIKFLACALIPSSSAHPDTYHTRAEVRVIITIHHCD
jgi:hypothetical protein